MKPLSEQDHYEILEIPRNAGPTEIERGYRLSQATYADDSLAGYSVLTAEDAAAMRERIEVAYRVLSNHESRRAYDTSLAAGDEDESWAPAQEIPEAVESPLPMDDFEELDDQSGDFDGARLRRTRLRRGVELEQIAAVTKINPTYLRFLEEERFADLPASVYVRGFVSAYASYLGLDPRRVAVSYMKRFEVRPSDPKRSRFLGMR